MNKKTLFAAGAALALGGSMLPTKKPLDLITQPQDPITVEALKPKEQTTRYEPIPHTESFEVDYPDWGTGRYGGGKPPHMQEGHPDYDPRFTIGHYSGQPSQRNRLPGLGNFSGDLIAAIEDWQDNIEGQEFPGGRPRSERVPRRMRNFERIGRELIETAETIDNLDFRADYLSRAYQGMGEIIAVEGRAPVGARRSYCKHLN